MRRLMEHVRNRGAAIALGALAFAAAHAIIVSKWGEWFGGLHEPWFLNSGRAVAFTTALLFGVGLAGGLFGLSGLMIAAGAFVTMTVVFFRLPDGPGNIFPVVVVSGGLLILGAAWLGAWIGRELHRPDS
jgi:hypothetical protein